MTKCCFSHGSGIISYITLSEENLFSIYMNCTEEMCIRFTELYNYWNTVIIGSFHCSLYKYMVVTFNHPMSNVISLFIAQFCPLQLLRPPFYWYDCKAFKPLEKLQLLYTQISLLVSRKYNKTCSGVPLV